jgi:hypothetical protein
MRREHPFFGVGRRRRRQQWRSSEHVGRRDAPLVVEYQLEYNKSYDV